MKKIGIVGLVIFSVGLYCSEFLIPKKQHKKVLSCDQLIHRLELLMRTSAQLITKIGKLQEHSINTTVALIEQDKTNPSVRDRSKRQPFADHVSNLTHSFEILNKKVENFFTFINKMHIIEDSNT